MSDQERNLEGRKIILGITGSIAAYKSAILLRLLVKAGAEVQVIMTDSAKEFVGSLTFSTLSQKPVLSDLSNEQEWAQHVHLGQWADLILIAPASANTISKMANGLVDNLMTAVYLSAKCPVMIAPAMDLDMWNHPATQNNLNKLQSYGIHQIAVGTGPLASGLEGPGRLAEAEDIFEQVSRYFVHRSMWKDKKVIITAGPTFEPIDPVRFIGNHSSGKMGLRLAEQALAAGAYVELILGPVHEPLPVHSRLKIHHTQTADDMFEVIRPMIPGTDIFILAAAVADFKPKEIVPQKIKKEGRDEINLPLTATVDIAAHIGKLKTDRQFLCGFALETEDLMSNAKQKLDKKNMDLIVINSPNDPQSAFGFETNKVSVLDKSGKLISFELKSKKDVAIDIINSINEHLPA